MARWYFNELVHYRNETSKVQGFEDGTKDGETQPPSERRGGSIEETIVALAKISGRD